MKTKIKKIAFLTTGLAGALTTSIVAGAALSSCTVTTSGSSSDNTITLPDTWYSKDINWTDSTSLNGLLIDEQGVVYSNKYMTEVIAILPGYEASTITIPASVRSITGYNNVTTSGNTTTKTATGAFQGLESLTKVLFAGKNVTQIGSSAFKNCINLQSITLPSSVTLIGDSVFSGCTSLSSINLNNVQYIGANAFNNAFSYIPNGSVSLNLNSVSFIGAYAFTGATGLKTVDFSKNTSLTSIGNYAFQNCSYIEGTINLSNDNYLISIGEYAFQNCSLITNFYIVENSSLRTLGSYAFSGCTSLVSIGTSSTTSGFIVPSTVQIIGTLAFENTLIASFDLSQNTATNPLQAQALMNMPELASVNLGTSITTLNAQLFYNSPKLTSALVVPASVTSVTDGEGTNPGQSSYTPTTYSTFDGASFSSIDLSNVSSYDSNSTYATQIPRYLFRNCSNLTTVKLKETTSVICVGAFEGCSALKNVIFGAEDGTGVVANSNLTSIESRAFATSGIETVNLSAVTSSSMFGADNQVSGTESGGNRNIFTGCSSLTTVNLPSSTVAIPQGTFYQTPALTTVNFTDLVNLATISGYNFSSSSLSSIDLSSTKLTTLGSSTTNNYVFNGLSTQPTVSLPSTLTTVYSTVFTSTTTSDSGTATTISLPLTYPNGYSIGSSTVNLSSSNLITSRVKGSFDLSSSTTLNSISSNTFFGNSTLIDLTFNASVFASGTINTSSSSNSAAKYTYLGFIGSNITSENSSSSYLTANLPFGNNSSLNAITFNNFSSSSSSSSNSNDNVLSKTTADTWSQVTRIINSFASSSTDASSSSESINLTSWGNTSEDISVSVSKDDDSDVVTGVSFYKTGSSDTNLAQISSSSTSESFEYSGVTWSISVNNGTITITGSNIDTYRSVVAANSYYSTSYKTFFNTKEETTSNGDEDSTTKIVPNSDITVTLNVVVASSSES